MINTLTMLCQAYHSIEGYPECRYMKVETRKSVEENSQFSKIPVMYWDRSISNPLLKVPNGHFVIITGRLENHPDFGLLVLVEQLRHFPSNLKE
jgi:hypothetical protein